MSACKSKFEPAADPWATHTCDRKQHYGPHHCPVCGCYWVTNMGRRPNVVTDSRGVKIGATG
jgi:hypothetical protein